MQPPWVSVDLRYYLVGDVQVQGAWSVRLNQLLAGFEILEVRGGFGDVEVTRIVLDSRRAEPGSLFWCIRGAVTDGHNYAVQAVASGAVAVVCDRFLGVDVPQVRIRPEEARSVLALASVRLYDHPARDLAMVGVTGTNGKTTVTQLVRSILDAAGMPTGVIGTLSGERTTPEAPELQAILAEFRDAGRKAVSMEVSSHALTQHRVDGIVFDITAFTNLSHDHLDHHNSMEEYFAAKSSLFTPDRSHLAVVNVDDPWGERLAHQISGIDVVPVRRSDASEIRLAVGSSSFRWRAHDVTLQLTGIFNVDNALMAATVASQLGLGEDVIRSGLASAPPPPGRMEVVATGPPIAVLVDFAHTPAGLAAALSSARRLAGEGRVICLFGCGGDRDPGKRPLMGEVAGRMSDIVVLTSDNPRSEDPKAIIDQVIVGVAEGVELVVEPGREAAIGRAVALARPGDLVLLAGKGHETTQIVGDRADPFDDREMARRALGADGHGGRE